MAKASKQVEERISGILLEELSLQNDEKDKTLTPQYKEYYKRKIAAIGLEKINHSKIVLFESVNASGRSHWYKMIGNSALFYKYFVGPRLRKAPAIRFDTDLQHKTKTGVVSVNTKEKFIENMAKLGYDKYQESELGLTIFDLGKKFTDKEIEEFKKQNKKIADEFNSVIKPKNNIPEIYVKIVELAKLVTPKMKHLDLVYREMIGKRLTENIERLAAAYLKFANGLIMDESARAQMMGLIMEIRAGLIMLTEARILNYSDAARIGGLAAELEMAIVKKIK
ncbi:hypothetical protein IKW75_02355 [Candidatus Saccharibacteria bacterium]|nr:hypothetical protein [Candidatus Saccharibacteria bacterium]